MGTEVRTIVLIGNSPLTFFLARELDRSLANLVHFKVVWLTTEDSMPGLGHFGQDKIIFKEQIHNVRIVKTEVKSITLRDKHIVTTRGIINYNLLLIDQAPYYRSEELQQINKSVDELLMSVRAQLNQGKKTFAKILTKGEGVEALQLACSIADRVKVRGEHTPSQVVVNFELAIKNPKLKQFLSHSVKQTKAIKEQIATLSIAAPHPMVDLRVVKGLKLDKKDQAMIESNGFVQDHPEVIILNESNRAWQNLLRTEKSLAGQLSSHVGNYLAGLKSELQTGSNSDAFTIKQNGSIYVKLGDMVSVRIRARLINQLEKQLLRNLANKAT